MEQQLSLHITLLQPPPGIDFGLQEGKGSEYKTIQCQRSGKHDLHFEAVIKIKSGKDGRPDFSGPLVQGPAGERFIYIDIGTYAGQTGTDCARRLKIPLKGIDASFLLTFSATPNAIIEANINGTGKDGGPTCGTVKPFDGWKIGHAKK